MQHNPNALVTESVQAEARASRDFGDALRTMKATRGGRLSTPLAEPPPAHDDMNAELRHRAGQTAAARSRSIAARIMGVISE